MDWNEFLYTIFYGVLIIMLSFLLVGIFRIQKILDKETYFSFSEFFVAGVTTYNLIVRFIIIICFNCVIYLVLNNFVDSNIGASMCFLSTVLGSILIVYPAFLNKVDIPNEKIKTKINYLYVSFVLFSTLLSFLTIIILILLFNDISIVDLWEEQKNTILISLLIFIPMQFINPIIRNKKLTYAIEEEKTIESYNSSLKAQMQQSEDLFEEVEIEEDDTNSIYEDNEEFGHTPAIEPDRFVSLLMKLIRIYETIKRI